MSGPKLSKLELQIMETLWTRGEVSIREIQESFPDKSRPSYGTIQITIYRMEEKRSCAAQGRLATSTSLSRSSPEMQLN